MRITNYDIFKKNASFIKKITLPVEFMDKYSKETTIHGVKYFSERQRHWTEKSLWFIIFTVSISLCIKNVLEIYEKRQSRPVMISIAKDLSSTFEIPFPAVTICPETKAKIDKINISKALNQDLKNLSVDEIINLQALSQVCDFSDDRILMRTLNHTKSRHEVISVLQNLSYSMDEMFSRCRYGSRKLTECKKLFYKVMTDEGLCYTFNMMDQQDLFDNNTLDEAIRHPNHGTSSDWFLEKDYESAKIEVFPHRVFGSGVEAGLAVELSMNKSQLNPGCKRGIKGFRLLFHSPVELPLMSQQFYSIPFQKLTMISVKPMSIYPSYDLKGYDPGSRQCYFHNERKLKFFKTYAKSSCHLECLAEQIRQACGCVKFSLPHDNKTEVCDLSKLDCMHEAEYNYIMNGLQRKLLSKEINRALKEGRLKKSDERYKGLEKRLKKIESCNCLSSCTSLKYEAEITQTDFSVTDNDEVLTASVVIYFKSAHFMRLKRYEVYALSDLLSSTGGIFGLFLGCSVLSFIELVYHIVSHCVRKLKNSSNQVVMMN